MFRARAQWQGVCVRPWTFANGRGDRHEATGNAYSPDRMRTTYNGARENAAF